MFLSESPLHVRHLCRMIKFCRKNVKKVMEISFPNFPTSFLFKERFMINLNDTQSLQYCLFLTQANLIILSFDSSCFWVLFICLSLSLCNCVSLSLFHLELHYHFPLLLLLLFLSLFICSHIRISNFRMDSISLSRMPKYESIDPLPIVLYPMLTYFIRNNLFAKNEKTKPKTKNIKLKSCISTIYILY